MMKKEQFLKVVKEKVKQAAFKYLLEIKATHSKVKNIVHNKLEIQSYLKSCEFTTAEKELLLGLRSRMTSSMANFRTMYGNIICNLCDKEEQTDAHLLDCSAIIKNCPELANNCDAEYQDIFGTTEEQLKITRLYTEVFKIKVKLEDNI